MEKRARRKEYRVYARLAEQFRQSDPPLAPELYFGKMRRHDATLYMELLPRVGNPPQLTQRNVERLADRIFLVALLTPSDYSRFHQPLSVLTPGVFDDFLAVLNTNRAALAIDLRARLQRCVAEFRTRHADLILVPCHNDLHWHNICTVNSDSGVDFRFLDWQLFSLNYLGADLNRLALGHAASFQVMLEHYSARAVEVFPVDKSAVALGAYSYALCRIFQSRMEADLPTAVRLLEHVERQLGIRG